jgi:hypothetical protein
MNITCNKNVIRFIQITRNKKLLRVYISNFHHTNELR